MFYNDDVTIIDITTVIGNEQCSMLEKVGFFWFSIILSCYNSYPVIIVFGYIF